MAKRSELPIREETPLILIADHCIENQGRFLTDRELRAFGHDVQALLTHCEPIARKYRDGKEFATRPSSAIHDGIVLTLSEFGKISRYYNLDLVAGGRGAQLRRDRDCNTGKSCRTHSE